ncbi:photosystem II S4 domain protein [Synechococcus sp. RSCCF101]|uniref:photosystem II S4 domain protein n=1 Tax=Synechococcus sp. RSCCF101 TaxID=2511069 RepID=UPI001780F651|nr:photosystem II S4 domain protein [Synechococcus sp. RSCCF101]
MSGGLSALLRDCRNPDALRPLLVQAEASLRTWTVQVTPFLPGPIWHELTERLSVLSELQVQSHGGVPGAERRRLIFSRAEQPGPDPAAAAGCEGLAVHANFLFDRPSGDELRQAVESLGVSSGALGDAWLCGDRGGQMVCTDTTAGQLDGRGVRLRDLELRLERIDCDWLQPPQRRAARRFTSIEASCRLDAVASAGFGISRARAARLIRSGGIRLNWETVSQPSRPVSAGDRLQLADRGEVSVEQISQTKLDRWRLELARS